MRNCSMKLPEKRQKYQEIDKYGYYTGAETLPSDQRLSLNILLYEMFFKNKQKNRLVL